MPGRGRGETCRRPCWAHRMRLGSLCSGVGGLDLAAESHFDAVTVWHAEVDADASAVLAARWPGVPNLGDLTVVDWSAVEPVDIITAGYPCQPFSLAGNRKGTADVRHLWPYVADAVRVLRPRYVVLENVAGHLSLGFDQVLGDLATLRFDAEWTTVRASDIGAPHRRERLFVVARNTDVFQRGVTENGLGSSASETAGEQRDAGRFTGAAADADSMAWQARGTFQGRPGTVGEPGTVEGTVGLHRPSVADTDGDRLEGDNRATQPRRDQPNATRSSAPSADWGKFAPAVRRWEAVQGPAPDPLVDGRLNPQLTEWMMGYPSGWVTSLPLKRTAMLKLCGNAVVPQAALLALRLLDRQSVAA